MDEAERVEPMVDNKNIEDAAVRFVIEEERRFGREATTGDTGAHQRTLSAATA